MISVNFAYTDYISNWADISCALWGILSAQNAFFRNTYEVEKWLLRAFNAIAPSSAFCVCWGYFVSKSQLKRRQHCWRQILNLSPTSQDLKTQSKF